MSYDEIKTRLISQFEKNDFKKLFNEGKCNCVSIHLVNDFNLNLKVTFPGYKSGPTRYVDFAYDYKFTFNGIPISHEDIVRDLNLAVTLIPDIFHDLYNLLIDLARNALNIDMNTYLQLSEQYENINTKFSLKELTTIIPYIVSQEDINYPIYKNLQGRKMSFYRYIESLLCTLPNSTFNLDDVISRTNIRFGRPPQPYSEFSIYYKPIESLTDNIPILR